MQFIDDPDRARVTELLALDEYVDMIIPRGGAGLHQFCRENSRIPVITGGIGICHLFVDESADLDAALEIIHNAKTQRPTVCNALDTVLVHRAVAADFLPACWCEHLARPASPSAPMPSALLARSTNLATLSAVSSARPARTISTPNGFRWSWASRWWRAWTRPSSTSPPTAPATRTAS